MSAACKGKINLQEIIDYFEQREGWDKQEVITDCLGNFAQLQENSADEIGLEWDGETLMTLDDFAEVFFDEVIKRVCNVLKSYKD